MDNNLRARIDGETRRMNKFNKKNKGKDETYLCKESN